MKRIIINLTLCLAFLLATVFAGTPKTFSASASSAADTLNYVSLGDSIAEGTGLAGFAGKAETDFVEESYAYLFKEHLGTRYSNINAISYAKSGDDTANLLEKLKKNESLRDSVSEADIITICIGANDILGPAMSKLSDLIIGEADISPQLQEGLDNFTNNFPQIMNLLYELNPNAVKIFTNVYNPFRDFCFADAGVTITASIFNYNITKDKIKEIGNMAEDFIAGNEQKVKSDPSISRIYGLNERMAGFLQGKDVVTSGALEIETQNCHLIDSKGLFDGYSGNEKLVNVTALEQPNNIIYVNISNIANDLYQYLDPHPTIIGHEIIYNNFLQEFNNFAIVNYNYNGGELDGKSNNILITKKGQTLVEPLAEKLPYKSGYTFTAWSYEKRAGELENWNFNNSVQDDLTLNAGWIGSYSISFNTGGGNAIESQSLNEGDKIIKPQDPVKALSTDIFAGWYYLGENNEKIFWDFENDVVSKNLTLIAKWVNLNCNNNNLLVQKIDDLKPIKFFIDIDTNIQWYVENKLQSGHGGNEFEYTPPEKAGSYKVSCVVNGNTSKEYIVVVNYIVPTNINAELKEVNDSNLYSFEIENGNFIDDSKVVWYATIDQFTDEVRKIGEGATCKARISNKCKVYAVYGDDICVSKAIEVDPPVVINNSSYVIISIAVGILLFVILLTAISRKRYKDYY